MKKLQFNSRNTALFVIILMTLFISNLILSQEIMNINLSLRDTQDQIQKVLNQNRQLKVKAAKLSATANLLKQAKKNGFVETVNIVYLPDRDILARND